MYNEENQGKVNQLQCTIEEIESRKARGVAPRSRVIESALGEKNVTCECDVFTNTMLLNSNLTNTNGCIFHVHSSLTLLVRYLEVRACGKKSHSKEVSSSILGFMD